MFRVLAFVRACFILLLCHSQVLSIIVSPCKVQNLITQPTHGTSLKTKGLVNILQVFPVFVQNVMVGICETKNRNVSTGRMGEFFTCQQRYSAVEVYIADDPYATGGDINEQRVQPTVDNLSSLKFVRESVIIESGCDFTFNLLPFVTSQNQPQGAQTQQQRMLLRSPYHNSIPMRPSPQQADPSTGLPVPDNLYHGRTDDDEIVVVLSPNDSDSTD